MVHVCIRHIDDTVYMQGWNRYKGILCMVVFLDVYELLDGYQAQTLCSLVQELSQEKDHYRCDVRAGKLQHFINLPNRVMHTLPKEANYRWSFSGILSPYKWKVDEMSTSTPASTNRNKQQVTDMFRNLIVIVRHSDPDIVKSKTVHGLPLPKLVIIFRIKAKAHFVIADYPYNYGTFCCYIWKKPLTGGKPINKKITIKLIEGLISSF